MGIHNVLEAAVYGVPVMFGPNNKRFREAQQLLEEGGAFEIHDEADFKTLTDRLLTDADYLRRTGYAAGLYVKDHAGATDKILDMIDF